MTDTVRKWFILMSTGIMIMLVNLDMTIVNLSLAEISLFFNASINSAQWIIVGYLLSTALSFIIFGKLADNFGRKRIFLVGVVLFTFSSLLAGLTNNFPLLIMARFVQGLGFAASLGLSVILIVSAFPSNKKGYAVGLAITITGLSQAIGPTIGGIVLQHLNWHWIFLLNVPLGIISFIGSLLFLPKDASVNSNGFPIQFYNSFLFLCGLGLVLFSLNQASVLSWSEFLSLLFIGFVILFLFIHNCFNSEKPLVDLELLVNHNYLCIVLLRFFFMIAMSSLLFIIPLYLQNILNYSPIKSGGVLLIMTFFVAISSPITGKLLDAIGFIHFFWSSFVFMFISALLMLQYDDHISLLSLSGALICFGLAVGIHNPSSMNGVLLQIPKDKYGTGVGMFFTFAMIGATLGIALTGWLMHVFSKIYIDRSTIFVTRLPENLHNQILKAATGTVNIKDIHLSNDQFYLYKNIILSAFIHGFHAALMALAFIMFLSILLAWKLKRRLLMIKVL